MTKTTTTKKVPELRFPEFEGDWEKIKLSNKCNFFSGGTPISSNTKYYKGNIPFIGSGEIHNDTTHKKITYEALNNSSAKLVQEGDILYALYGATSGEVSISKIDGAINQAVLCIRTDSINNYLLCQILNFNKGNIVAKYLQGGQGNLSSSIIKSLNFHIPKFPEQQKIANFLTQVDKKIELLEKKQVALEQYKKGVMQKIFNREIRFQIENEAGERIQPPAWEEKKLGEIGEVFNGLTGKTKEDFGEGYPFIQYKQIFDNSRIDITKCNYVNLGNNEKQREVKFGDAFFTVSSETPDEIGTSSILLNDVKSMYLNSFCFGYRMNKEELLPEFARYLFRSNYFRKKIIPLAQGSTRFNMSKNNFVKLIINLPNVKEQTKIANFLSALDQKIEAVAERSRSHREWKKGLLQKMFV